MGKLSDKAIQAAKAKEKQYGILDVLVGLWHGWLYVNLNFALTFLFLFLFSLALSFWSLNLYCEAIAIIRRVRDFCPEMLVGLLKRYHE